LLLVADKKYVERRLQQLGLDCIVVAPSKTPEPNGGRQKRTIHAFSA
jgi:hypothetical protein